jgi:hypothetical protein
VTPEQRSEKARKAAKARWSKARPLSKRKRERLLREVAKMTPEDRKREAKEFAKELSGFMNLYKDRPMD